MSELLVHFPWMHPKLAGPTPPQGVHWFDPGVDLPGEHVRWRPVTLPYSNVQVRRLVREFLQFANLFPKPSDIQAYQAAGIHNFYTDTTMDLVSQLTAGSAVAKPESQNLLRQAQLTLALAFFREEAFLDIHTQKARFEHAQDGFVQALGLNLEDDAPLAAQTDPLLFPRAHTELPWKDLLLHFLAFLPPGTNLFISDPGVLQEFMASELKFSPCTQGDLDLLCCDLDEAAIQQLCGPHLALASGLRVVTTIQPLTHENRL